MTMAFMVLNSRHLSTYSWNLCASPWLNWVTCLEISAIDKGGNLWIVSKSIWIINIFTPHNFVHLPDIIQQKQSRNLFRGLKMILMRASSSYSPHWVSNTRHIAHSNPFYPILPPVLSFHKLDDLGSCLPSHDRERWGCIRRLCVYVWVSDLRMKWVCEWQLYVCGDFQELWVEWGL